MNRFVQPLDSPEVYEAGKPRRVMPDNLRELGVYTLRILSPPGEAHYAADMLSMVTKVEPHERVGFFVVSTFFKPLENEPGITLPFLTSSLGYIVMELEGGATEEEMGYFLGPHETGAGIEQIAQMFAEPELTS